MSKKKKEHKSSSRITYALSTFLILVIVVIGVTMLNNYEKMKKVNLFISKTFIVIMALVTLFPFVYMILASLMTFQEATSIPPTLVPKVPQWKNFALAMEQAPFVRYFFNTVLVAGLSTIGALITSILAAFALVKLEFKFKNVFLRNIVKICNIYDKIQKTIAERTRRDATASCQDYIYEQDKACSHNFNCTS